MRSALPQRAPRLFHSPDVKQESLFGIQSGYAAQSEAGRHCAFLALEALESGLGQRGVSAAPDGRILWPAGVLGGITHTAGFASAAVVRQERARSIGIDSEVLFPSDIAREMAKTVYRPGEGETLSDFAAALAQLHGACAESLLLTLIFSIKESCGRCFAPLASRFFGFQSVGVESLGENGEFQSSLAEFLGPELPPGLRLRGQFLVKPPYVHTGLWLPL